ncbi:MAG: phosphoenolpyruvate-protein phosphotransferase, partial [Ectothiorhodospiraceae bacterium]|nr:phosphoenolpyruvate-protein phosphotransferase [Ectothiorhodospiraceae bacterium]
TPPHGRMPDVAYYEKTFAAICEAAAPLPVTFRLLDISVDKKPPWLGEMRGMTGLLGLQGSRLFGIRPVSSVLEAQLSALARVSAVHDLRVLMPYVASPDEFRHWKHRIRMWLPDRIAIGAMAETPAAALAMPEWRRDGTRVSIGCNDLMQCLFGADRDIPEVAGYLDPYSPYLFRFLQLVADAAAEHMDQVQLCGLLQQLPGVLSILLGLGYRQFSMSPRLIPALAGVVRETRLEEARQLAMAVQAASDSASVRELLGFPPDARPAMPWVSNG